MLTEAGVRELQRYDTPSELLQPLVPRYEEALSQLERAIQVRKHLRWVTSGHVDEREMRSWVCLLASWLEGRRAWALGCGHTAWEGCWTTAEPS